MVLDVADENNAALHRLDALEKSLGQAEKKATDAVEAKECLQKEAVDREEKLTAAVAAREKEMVDRLMAVAKAFSGEFPFACLDIMFFYYILPRSYSSTFSSLF